MSVTAAWSGLFPKTWPEDQPRGLMNWPLVPHPIFTSELTLACPQCGSTKVTITGASLKEHGLGRGWTRLECGSDSCRFYHWQPSER